MKLQEVEKLTADSCKEESDKNLSVTGCLWRTASKC